VKCFDCERDCADEAVYCGSCVEEQCIEAGAEGASAAAADVPDTASLIRSYADRGRIYATMKPETVEELYELATRIELGEPVT
jgi:hypothetical protein